MKGKIEPLFSWPDGKIRCTELPKTRLRAQGREVHSHISVKPAPKTRGQAQRQETCGMGQSGRAF